jgi:FtsP/CotA-like multicopper oxidase with cupredoxin domain
LIWPPNVLVAVSHEHAHATTSNHAGMGGMIVGITVTGPSQFNTGLPDWQPERQLALTIASQDGDPLFHQVELSDLSPTADERPQRGTGVSGPVIALAQGQPVEITIVNELSEPTSIHWHGVELESYYDGVPVWGGIGDLQSPAVEPGQSFNVRMEPPRAGTFMYHSHWHDNQQLERGVYGMLIVMPPGEAYDPATDKAFVVTQSVNPPYGAGMILMNGLPQLAEMELETGVPYRLRFGNLTPGVNNLRVSLRQDSTPVEWRWVSKDAFAVAGTPLQRADQMIAIGETFDFVYTATSPQTLTLEALAPNNGRRAIQTLTFTNP